MEASGRLERGLRHAQPIRKTLDQGGRDLEVALHEWRLDGDGLERALAADAARGGGVEAPPQRARVEARRVHLDRVRRQVVGEARSGGRDPLREAEAERQVL